MTVLELRQLSVGYRTRGRTVPVVSGVNVSLAAGDLVGLVGPNGAGKSTLLRTIAGLQPALSGEIEVLGCPMGRLPRHELARQLAVVLTDQVNPGRLRVDEVVGLGRHPHTGWDGRLTPADERVVGEALEAVGAADLSKRMMWELSDGQRQRVMIARALAQDPRLLLLDEPTAFLDPPGRIRAFELLQDLAHERDLAVVVSTHDVEVAARHVERLWLVGGTPGVSVGTPSELAATGQLAAAFGNGVRFDPVTCLFVSSRAALANKDLPTT